MPSRLAAALVALAAWFGLAVQLEASSATTGDVVRAIWAMLLYFTVLSNLLVAIVFTAIALGARSLASPAATGFLTTVIVLVGVVYGFLLHGLVELSGGAVLANVILHRITPVLVPLFWLIFTPKGQLKWSGPLNWTLFPLAYFIYAWVRGATEGKYPYPFINVAQIGWQRAVSNGLMIGIGFVVGGLILVLVDHGLARIEGVRAKQT